MTALSEALAAAQRQAIAAASKAFVAGNANETELLTTLDYIGATDKADQDYLLASLHVLQRFGTAAPEMTKPSADNAPASKEQADYVKRLADKAGVPLPGYPLTKAQASQIIDELKLGTYNAESWEVPF